MSRQVRIIGLNLVLIILGLAVLALSWQLVQRIQVAPITAQKVESVADQYPAAADIYQIEIRNGAGVKGAAETMRRYLIEKGYDVVEVGNHTSFDVEKTLIVDRVGNREIARQVAVTLGLTEEHIVQEERQEYYLDASVIIGKDLLILPVFTRAAADAQEN